MKVAIILAVVCLCLMGSIDARGRRFRGRSPIRRIARGGIRGFGGRGMIGGRRILGGRGFVGGRGFIGGRRNVVVVGGNGFGVPLGLGGGIVGGGLVGGGLVGGGLVGGGLVGGGLVGGGLVGAGGACCSVQTHQACGFGGCRHLNRQICNGYCPVLG